MVKVARDRALLLLPQEYAMGSIFQSQRRKHTVKYLRYKDFPFECDIGRFFSSGNFFSQFGAKKAGPTSCAALRRVTEIAILHFPIFSRLPLRGRARDAQLRAEQAEIAALKKEVTRFMAERDILKKASP